MKKSKFIYLFIAIVLCLFICNILIFSNSKKGELLVTSSNIVSNKKIGWGLKRDDNNKQPDLGTRNKELINKYSGIAMGNNEDKYVYLTFDEGYEAGYTEKILDILKANDVKATFFITAHYLNTNTQIIQRMIDEGHIVGNHIPTSLMSFI